MADAVREPIYNTRMFIIYQAYQCQYTCSQATHTQTDLHVYQMWLSILVLRVYL